MPFHIFVLHFDLAPVAYFFSLSKDKEMLQKCTVWIVLVMVEQHSLLGW